MNKILPFPYDAISYILISFFLGLLLRKIIFSRISKWASKTNTQLDDIIIAATKGQFLIWCFYPVRAVDYGQEGAEK